MDFLIKRKKPKPIATMVMPGRRALGEGWQEVTIYADDKTDTIHMDRKPVEAPAENKPIYIPSMGNLSSEAVSFLMEGARKSQEYGHKDVGDMSPREYHKWINEMWMAFVEAKLKAFKGVSTFGPGGQTQRQSPAGTIGGIK
jgi:hypothetical protein